MPLGIMTGVSAPKDSLRPLLHNSNQHWEPMTLCEKAVIWQSRLCKTAQSACLAQAKRANVSLLSLDEQHRCQS